MTFQNEPMNGQGPLAGLKVLDIATIIAAPFAAALMADYGAEVLKVELPGVGDGARDFPPFKDGKSLWWKVINRNKQFTTLDLRQEKGAELFRRLVAEYDVLIENFRPGTLDRWGLTREELWKINPSLVILRVTGFGQDGPYSKRPGFARIFEAMGGLTYLTGEADGQPMHPGYPIGDAIGGLFGATSILAALFAVRNDPERRGEEIDLSLTESTLKLLEFLPIEYDQTGDIRERAGNANQYSAPAAVFATQDGRWVSLAGSTNAVFARNCQAIGQPDLPKDPRFATNAERLKYTQELNQMFADYFASVPLDEALRSFEEAGGTLAPVYSIDQIYTDPQMRARDAITRVADDDFDVVRMQNVVPRFRNRKARHRRAAGALGRDTDRVLSGLGLSDAEIATLRKDKIV